MPKKPLEFVSHIGLLHVTIEEAAGVPGYRCRGSTATARTFVLRRVGTNREIARSPDLYRLREIGDEWVEAYSA